ncbi:hypothetical protein D4R86_04610 [bacterium]|nr:MAG: hypothetical protein D4R86_04610 [bacterium]
MPAITNPSKTISPKNSPNDMPSPHCQLIKRPNRNPIADMTMKIKNQFLIISLFLIFPPFLDYFDEPCPPRSSAIFCVLIHI